MTDAREQGWDHLAGGVRLVATDLDGTLLRHDGSVSSATVETLARARAEGLPVVFVTGRPPRWLPPVAEATGHSGLAVGANGAVVADLGSGRLLEAHPLPPSALAGTVSALRAEVPGIAFAVEWVMPSPGAAGTTFAYEPGFRTRFPVEVPPTDADVRSFSEGRDVVKLLARVEDTHHDADTLLELALGHVAHLVTVTHSNAADVLLEMSARGVTKATTLARVAASLDVPAEHVAAVGDMPNDVPMLRWAGTGLAVANAHPLVRAAADAVVPDPQHDGVGAFVRRVLTLREIE